MAVTVTKTPSIKLDDRRSVFVKGDTLKIGTRGKSQSVRQTMELLTKGERRKVRRSLDRMGMHHLSHDSVPRPERVSG